MPAYCRRLLFCLSIIFFTGTIVFFAISRIRAASLPSSPPSSNLTLIFPDQEYTISLADLSLPINQPEIIIPSKDQGTPHIIYNPATGQLEAISMPQDYVVQVSDLINRPESFFHPPYVLRGRFEDSLASYNSRLAKTFSDPLKISLKNGNIFSDYTLSPDFLRTLIFPPSTDPEVPLSINKKTLLASIVPQLTANERRYFDPEATYANTVEALNARFMDQSIPTSILGVDDGPTSAGEFADKYLEIDLSQQKMYFFINHQLFRAYRVSTGDTYPTPVGDYHILNKAPKAFSSIYNVWMPYWMGFKYASDIGAYLGIHEIAYAVNDKGKPFYKHGYYIGEMYTGGCIAMEPKDAPEVYNLAEIGMLLRVVP